MADIFQQAGQEVAKVEQDVVKGAEWVKHIYTTVTTKLKAFEKAEPALVTSLSNLVQKGEIFLAASVPAITDKGLDIPADTAAFAALEGFVKSFEAAASALEAFIGAA